MKKKEQAYLDQVRKENGNLSRIYSIDDVDNIMEKSRRMTQEF